MESYEKTLDKNGEFRSAEETVMKKGKNLIQRHGPNGGTSVL